MLEFAILDTQARRGSKGLERSLDARQWPSYATRTLRHALLKELQHILSELACGGCFGEYVSCGDPRFMAG